LVGGNAGEPEEFSREPNIGQTAREEIVYGANRNAKARGKLVFVFKFRRGGLACAGCGLNWFALHHRDSWLLIRRKLRFEYTQENQRERNVVPEICPNTQRKSKGWIWRNCSGGFRLNVES
jgi:hypothetical protein